MAAAATLFTHEGAGHQLKLNKAASGDTASLLFQTGWSGRAEMGAAGTDDFTIKVSADGSAWTTALSVDAASGQVSGAAVQASETDGGAGKLLRSGAFGLGARLQSATVSIADDAVAILLPPNTGGFLAISPNFQDNFPQQQQGGLAVFDAGPSPYVSAVWSGSAFALAAVGTVLTGTTGNDGAMTLSAPGDGTLLLENRCGAARLCKLSYF